jgi:uncharacterized protein
MSHLDTVKTIYAAFGRFDVPAILEFVDPSCVWEYGAVPNGVPWLEPRKGREGAGAFFQVLGAELDVTFFEVSKLLDGGTVVAAMVSIDFTVKRNGNKISERDEVHLWHFGENGRLVKFRHVADTFAHVNAWAGGK